MIVVWSKEAKKPIRIWKIFLNQHLYEISEKYKYEDCPDKVYAWAYGKVLMAAIAKVQAWEGRAPPW